MPVITANTGWEDAALLQATADVLALIVASKAFENTPTLRSLLLYLWDHRNEPISEYAIATEGLGRNNTFDSKTDATVRVQISRLRKRLEKFYEEEGRDSQQIVSIPVGSHHLKVEARKARGVEALDFRQQPERLVDSPTNRSSRRWILALSAGCLALLTCCIILAILLDRAKSRAVPSTIVLPRFWSAFFGNAKPTRILFPTPVFFAYTVPGRTSEGSVMLRDTNVNDFSKRDQAAATGELDRLFGKPSLATSYTVTSDTFAAVRLARYLDRAGLVTNVFTSASAPLEVLDNENIIAVGTWGTLTPLEPYLNRMTFQLENHEKLVRNKQVRAGEKAEYPALEESPQRIVYPGVVAVLPGTDAGITHLLIVASRHTASLVSFLTSGSGLSRLDALWKENGSPEFYEVIINSEMNGDDLVGVSPVALHPYRTR
jgi:hypothetical protein